MTTKTTKTTKTTINQQLTMAAEIVGGKAWGADKGKPRIYLGSRRDRKVYIGFEDTVYPDGENFAVMADAPITGLHGLEGARLHVYIDDCGQHPNWYAAERQKALAGARAAFDAISWFLFSGDEVEARRIYDEELEIDDVAAGHMANGREAEARAAIGL